ncbi:MAG TPA: hypothetical protein DFS52_21455 [Myxococcales bacterium]|nr:hypothetical protein [Myxococcales bacterium]
MASFLLGIALLLLLAALGAGPTLALLPARWSRHWPIVAPIVGLCLLIVASDAPGYFLPSRTYGPPLILFLLTLSLGLAWRLRARARPLCWAALVPVLPLLAIGVWPIGREGILTTLGFRNHDYLFYTLVELQLLKWPQSLPDWLQRAPAEHFAAVARLGGWRMGLPFVSANLCALLRLLPHQLDGTLWAALYALFPGTVATAHALIVPRASRQARLGLLLLASLSGTSLTLLRIDAASQLAATLVLLLIWGIGWRALGARPRGMRALAGLLIAGLASLLHESAPFLLLLAINLVLSLRLTRRLAWGAIGKRLAWAVLAVALMPFTLLRALQAAQNLNRGAFGQWFGGELISLFPSAFGMGTGSPGVLEEVPAAVRALTVVGGLAGAALLLQSHRLRQPQRALVTSLSGGVVLLLGLLPLTGITYFGGKLAMTFHPFALVGAAAVADRLGPGHRGVTRALVGLLLAGNLAWITAFALQRERPDFGIKAEHLRLLEALRHHPGPVFLTGNLESPTPDPEHVAGYLLALLERPASHRFHKWSYFQSVRFEPRAPALDGRPELALVWKPGAFAEELVRGKRVFETESFALYDLSRHGSHVVSAAFEQGWHELEREPGSGRTYRWAAQEAKLRLDWVPPGLCLGLDVRPPPGSGATGVLATTGPLLRRYEIGSGWTRLKLPLEGESPELLLAPLSPPRPVPNDTRRLAFAVSRLELEPCVPPPVSELPSRLFFEEGWYGPESEPEREFRWSRDGARLRVRDTAAGSCLDFEARTGPTCPATEIVAIANGRESRHRVGPDWAGVSLPLEEGEVLLSLRPNRPPEAPAPDGRPLAIALGNPRVVPCGLRRSR